MAQSDKSRLHQYWHSVTVTDMTASTVTTPRVIPCTPTPDTLVDASFEQPDYRDAYVIDEARVDDIATFATQFFLSQPAWLAKASMNTPHRQQRLDAIADATYAVGTSVGTWKVHGRSSTEIVFGEHMGFMEYRFSFVRRPDGRVEASTSVHHLRRFGWIYFAIVKPFHKGFVRVALRHAATATPTALGATT